MIELSGISPEKKVNEISREERKTFGMLSVPAAAWKKMEKPALAVSIQADAAIDIGDTLVGMHIRPVAVPLRISTSHVGHANLVMAYSRLPYIGGARAVYTE